jgi:hypothetical protein
MRRSSRSLATAVATRGTSGRNAWLRRCLCEAGAAGPPASSRRSHPGTPPAGLRGQRWPGRLQGALRPHHRDVRAPPLAKRAGLNLGTFEQTLVRLEVLGRGRPRDAATVLGVK